MGSDPIGHSPCGRWRVLFHSALHTVLNAVIYSELFFLYDSDAPSLVYGHVEASSWSGD